jgi:malonate-semialdehyde dehydrogenase (acetylating)/methylmalonate-semialdehyde dehydrogenase
MEPCRQLANYVQGKWQPSQAEDYLDVTNPATGETLARVPLSNEADVAEAVAAAAAAFPAWRRTPPEERIQYLFRLKQLLESHQEEISRVLTMENGKTLAEARREVRRNDFAV